MLVKAPPATGQPIVHVQSQVLLSESREHVRHQLENYFAHKGVDLLDRFNLADDQFKLGYTGSSLDPTTKIPAPDSPEEAYRRRVVALTVAEIGLLKQQRAAFLDYFQRRANDTLGTMLDKSKEQIEADAKRYGASVKGWIFKDYSLAKNEETAGLADVAKQLQVKYQQYMEVAQEMAPMRAELPPGGPPNAAAADDYKKRMEAIEAQQKKLEPIEADYGTTRKQAEGKHPILAAYQLDLLAHDTPRHLAALASDTGEDRAKHIVTTINDKLENIKTVGIKANEDKTRVWKLERVVGPAKKLPDMQSNSPLNAGMRDAVVSDKVLSVQIDEEFRAAAIGVVTMAVGLLAALPSGGGSLAVAGAATAGAATAAVDVALLGQAVKDYQFESAASGSAYDKANAISQDDPSLFWLAMQFVLTSIGASMAVSQAQSAFVKIAQLKSEALGLKAAKMAAEAEQANRLAARYGEKLTELENAGEKLKNGAGQQLRQEVEAAETANVRRTGGTPDPDAPVNPQLKGALDTAPSGRKMTAADACSEYHLQIEANPNREYAVVRKGETGRHAVVIGEQSEVKMPALFALEGDWEFVTHYHPNFEWIDPKMMKIRGSNFHARIPSVKDMEGAVEAAARRNNKPFMERLDWRDPDRAKSTVYQTTYGYNPGAKRPYWVNYPNEMGGMTPMEFADMAGFEGWWSTLERAGPQTIRTPPVKP